MDKLRDLAYRLQDHPLYRKFEEIPRQKKLLGVAIAGLAIAFILMVSQLWGARTPTIELKPDEVAAARREAMEADRAVLMGLDANAMKDELERRTLSMEESKKAGDPDRIREAEEAWERVNEAMLAKKK